MGPAAPHGPMTDRKLKEHAMRSQLRLYAAGTVLAACSLVLTGPAARTTTPAPGHRRPPPPRPRNRGRVPRTVTARRTRTAGASRAPGGTQADGGTGNHEPDAPACTEKNTSITIRTAKGSGSAQIQLVNNSSRDCTVHDAPNVELRSSDDEILNPEPGIDENKESLLVTVKPAGSRWRI